MPFQKGNKLGEKGKLWSNALNIAIRSDRSARLLQAAQALLDQAAEGQEWAIKELANRLDGKAIQAVELEGHVRVMPHVIEAEELKARLLGQTVEVVLREIEDDESSSQTTV